MAYGDFKDLARRTAADKVLKDKAINIAKDPKYDGYQRGLASMIYTFFNKKTSGSGVKSIPQKERPLGLSMQELAEEFINQLLENLKKAKYIHHSEIIFRVLI